MDAMLLAIGVPEAASMSTVALAALGLVTFIFREHTKALRDMAAEHRAERKEMMGTLQQSTEASKALVDVVKGMAK